MEESRCKPRDKIADGWVYGKIKDAELKTHPCCVPYEQLPVEQRAKDYIFRAIVKTCIEITKDEPTRN